MAIGIAIVAYPLVTIVYGDRWAGSALPLAILGFAAVGLAVEAAARSLLFRSASPREISAAAAAGLVVNLTLKLALIPAIGITGSAIASLVSYWITAALMLELLRRTTGVSPRAAVAWPHEDDLVSRWWRRAAARWAAPPPPA